MSSITTRIIQLVILTKIMRNIRAKATVIGSFLTLSHILPSYIIMNCFLPPFIW